MTKCNGMHRLRARAAVAPASPGPSRSTACAGFSPRLMTLLRSCIVCVESKAAR